MTASTNGRRVLVAVVTGEVGQRIRAWREEFDPKQARRLPPHATLAYRAEVNPGNEDRLDQQVRHAFPAPIPVRLGEAHQFDNPEKTFYIEMRDTDALDAARAQLFDGAHFSFPEQRHTWDWHITVVRYGIRSDTDVIRQNLDALRLDTEWLIDTVAWLELRDGTYHEVRRWELA
jgi:2'-5' RNA ligase